MDGSGELDVDEFANLMSMDDAIKHALQSEALEKWGVGQVWLSS